MRLKNPMAAPDRNLPEAVLFDMDGTLLDSEHLHWDSAMEVLSAHRQRNAPAPRLQDWLGWNETHFWDAMRRDFGLAPGNDELTALRSVSFLRRFEEEGPRWTVGAVPLLELLAQHGVPMAVVTAAPRQQLDVVAERAGFGRWFRLWLSGEHDVPRSKPHPDPYLAAAEQLGIAPERCLAIEDSPTGSQSAVAAGCATIAVPSMPVPAERFPGTQAIMQDLRQVRMWLLESGLGVRRDAS